MNDHQLTLQDVKPAYSAVEVAPDGYDPSASWLYDRTPNARQPKHRADPDEC